MNPKTLIVLSVILIGLIGAFLMLDGSRIKAQTPDQKKPFRSGQKLFPNFKQADARIIEIKKGDVRVELTKRDADRWVISSKENRLVEKGQITRILKELSLAEVVDVRKGRLDKFDLDKDRHAVLIVRGEGGGELIKLDIGKSMGYQSCFARMPEKSPKQILTLSLDLERSIGSSTQKDKRVITVDHWYDLEILRFDQNLVTDIRIEQGGSIVALKKQKPTLKDPNEKAKEAEPKAAGEKGDGPDPKAKKDKLVWEIQVPEPMLAEQSACRGICSVAAMLFAKGYPDNVKKEDWRLNPPSAKTTLTLKDGTQYTFLFGKIEKDYAIMQLEGKPEVWKIERFNYEGLVKPLSKLKKDVLVRVETIKKAEPFLPPDDPKPNEKRSPKDPSKPEAKTLAPEKPALKIPEKEKPTEEKIKPDTTIGK